MRYTLVSGRWGWPFHNHAMNAQPLILVVDDDREVHMLLSAYLAGKWLPHGGGEMRVPSLNFHGPACG